MSDKKDKTEVHIRNIYANQVTIGDKGTQIQTPPTSEEREAKIAKADQVHVGGEGTPIQQKTLGVDPDLLSFLEEPANREVYQQMRDLLFEGQMVAFVGAECSIPLGYPTWGGLICKMLDKCIVRDPLLESRWRGYINSLKEKTISNERLLEIADQCKKKLDTDYFELLKEEFGPKPEKYTREHEYLLKLPFHRFITSNYDACLYHALNAVHGDLNKSFSYEDDRMAMFATCNDETRNLIFHCHGRYLHPQEIILTESDYQKHYENTAYIRILSALFLSNNVLFVGFSLSDADFGQIPRQLAALFDNSGPKHFVLLPMPEGGDEFTRREEVRRRYNIRVIFYPVLETQDGKPDHSARTRILEKLLDEWNEKEQTTSQMPAPTLEPEQPPEPPIGFETLKDSLGGSRNPRLLTIENFEQGQVFIDETKRQTIWNHLNDPDKRCCLIYGKSGSGKTVFAFALGYWLKANNHVRESFYLDLDRTRDSSEIFFRRLRESIISHNQPDLLFIIDNCHLDPNLTNELVQVAQEQAEQAYFLFISRPKGRRAFVGEAEYFELLDETNFELVADEFTFKSIIHNSAEGGAKPTDVTKVMQTCKSNLYLLSLLIEEWNDSTKALHELGRDVIYQKIYREHKAQMQSRALTKLSAIYQFEVPIPYHLVQEWDILQDVEELIKSDAVEDRLLKGGLHYFLPHPAYAEVVLETAEHHGLIRNQNAYERDICEQYIQSKPRYLSYFLSGLHNNEREDLLRHSLETIDFHLLKEGYWNPETDIFWIMLSWVLLNANGINLTKDMIWKNILGEGAVNQLAREIKKVNVYFLQFLIQQLIKVDKEVAKAFVDSLPHQPVMESFDIAGIGIKLNFLAILSQMGQSTLSSQCFSVAKELGEEFWITAFEKSNLSSKVFLLKILSKLGLNKLATSLIAARPSEQIIKEVKAISLTNFDFLLVNLSSIDRSLCNMLLDKITPVKLADILKSKLATIDELHIVLQMCSPNFRKPFLQAFEQGELLTIFNNSSLGKIGNFIQYRYRYPPIRKAYQTFEHEHLHAALEEASLEEIQKFIGRITFPKDAFLPHFAQKYAPNAVQKLEQVDIVSKLGAASLHNTAYFLWNVLVIDRAQVERYNLAVRMLGLRDKFGQSELHEINFFLWNLYQTSSELPETFRDGELRRVIADKAQDVESQKILETIGIFEFVRCPILGKEIPEPEFSTEVLEEYFWKTIEESSPFALMRTLKGLEMVDADWTRQFFDDYYNLTWSLIEFLEKNIKGEMTEETKRLHAECLAFLRRE